MPLGCLPLSSLPFSALYYAINFPMMLRRCMLPSRADLKISWMLNKAREKVPILMRIPRTRRETDRNQPVRKDRTAILPGPSIPNTIEIYFTRQIRY